MDQLIIWDIGDNTLKELTYLKNVTTLALDREKCSGCGLCLIVCPHSVFELENGKALVIDHDLCMECSACAMNCPESAIMVQSGVGCAAAVINSLFGSNITGCDCSINQNGNENGNEGQSAGCCDTTCGC
jgi:NAD-dependent dihydropyrimidine dehydrogenase PreA subunit